MNYVTCDQYDDVYYGWELRPALDGDGEWYEDDDTNCQELTEEEVLNLVDTIPGRGEIVEVTR